MRGLDIKNWGLWEWIAAASVFLAALIVALDAGLKDAPALAAEMPALLRSSIWPYTPLALLLIAFGVAFFRAREKSMPMKGDEMRMGVSPRMVGPFQISHEPPSNIRLLPLNFTINFAAPLPYVEVCFYVVHFVPRALVLTQVKLSLRVQSAPAIELIPLVQDDIRIEPNSTPIVTCRRNLTDSELRVLPKKTGRESASFELFAKAADGDKTLTYGPVGSMVIEGWVSAPG